MSRQRRRYVPSWPDYGDKRKRQGRAAIALLVLILIGVAASTFAPRSGDPPPSAGSLPSGDLALTERSDGWFASAPLEDRASATRVSVDHIVDGDTIDVLAAQTPLRVRFYGVDTPERDEPCYHEATARTTALVAGTVILVPDARQQDRSGRELRYVFTSDGRSLDATLIAEGLAQAWREDGVLRDRLVAIEEQARRARRGCLWAS